MRHADAGRGERYTVAVVRQVEQGLGEAQTVARDIIDDLAPRLILVVGIAGGLPSDEVTLGDVVLSTRIHDFTVEARKIGHEATYAATGGPIDRALANAVADLANREDELGDWTSSLSLPARPPVTWTEDGQLYGPPEWQHELRAKLEHHHPKGAKPRAPRYMAGPIASSDARGDQRHGGARGPRRGRRATPAWLTGCRRHAGAEGAARRRVEIGQRPLGSPAVYASAGRAARLHGRDTGRRAVRRAGRALRRVGAWIQVRAPACAVGCAWRSRPGPVVERLAGDAPRAGAVLPRPGERGTSLRSHGRSRGRAPVPIARRRAR